MSRAATVGLGEGPVRLLTFGEVCDFLRVSPKTLRAIVRRDELQAAKIGEGRLWRFRSDDLDSYLEALCQSTSEGASTISSSAKGAAGSGGRPAKPRSVRRKHGSATTAPASWQKHLPQSKHSAT